MEKIDCHSSTPKQDLIDFVERNKGKVISLHSELDGYDNWGNDDITEYDTSVPELYIQILESIKNHYIHGIKCVI